MTLPAVEADPLSKVSAEDLARAILRGDNRVAAAMIAFCSNNQLEPPRDPKARPLVPDEYSLTCDETLIETALGILKKVTYLRNEPEFRDIIQQLNIYTWRVRAKRQDLLQLSLFKPEPAPVQPPLDVWKE